MQIPIILIILQWPWMASIQINSNRLGLGFRHVCGGSVIEKRLVLTAAHCAKNLLRTRHPMRIVFGTSDLRSNSPYRTERNITDISIHPSYQAGQSYYDVALLILDKELVLNDGIKKIRLPQEATFDGSHRSGHLATLTGWGASEPGGAPSPELRQATMMIFHDQYCNSSRSIVNDQGIVESTSSLLPKLFTSSVFCAGLSLSGNQSIDNFLEYQFSSFRIPWRNKWSYLCRRFWKSFS